ncbi:hypothetical protein MEA186_01161 [Mesorhizobium amorphae CCNWGS0123]|uniref:Uncharacterized protein n=1 Tax=Mesorhizobium amorphae CCNWGS0123 TaxID=1082933 RepID=G6Y2X9_9HYPH|nr:hypothetical protein MEA186_01161 [Mesorhizobium amorphae CCNWGS0123]
MTRRLLIIGGSIQGMMSTFTAGKAGAFCEIIVTDQALWIRRHPIILGACVSPCN